MNNHQFIPFTCKQCQAQWYPCDIAAKEDVLYNDYLRQGEKCLKCFRAEEMQFNMVAQMETKDYYRVQARVKHPEQFGRNYETFFKNQ